MEKNNQNKVRVWKDIASKAILFSTNESYNESNYHYGNPNTTQGEE